MPTCRSTLNKFRKYQYLRSLKIGRKFCRKCPIAKKSIWKSRNSGLKLKRKCIIGCSFAIWNWIKNNMLKWYLSIKFRPQKIMSFFQRSWPRKVRGSWNFRLCIFSKYQEGPNGVNSKMRYYFKFFISNQYFK